MPQLKARSGSSASVTIGNATNTYNAVLLVDGTTESYSGLDLATSASDSDWNVVLVINGGQLTLADCTLTHNSAGGSDDAYNFYGLNSAVVVIGEGSSLTMDGCTIACADTAEGANAVFSSDGADVTASDLTVTTHANSSRGLHATYGGTITATDISITADGEHCAALATDRGGGTVTLLSSADSGQTSTLTTNGSDSPCIYSTGAIAATGAVGVAAKSEAIVVEGKNSLPEHLRGRGGLRRLLQRLRPRRHRHRLHAGLQLLRAIPLSGQHHRGGHPDRLHRHRHRRRVLRLRAGGPQRTVGDRRRKRHHHPGKLRHLRDCAGDGGQSDQPGHLYGL